MSKRRHNIPVRIVYLARESNTASIFIPIATGLRVLFPESENVLIDPSNMFWKRKFESSVSPAELFIHNGFSGQIISPDDYKEVVELSQDHKAYLFHMRLFKHLCPSLVIVPHEMGPSFYAVQTARLLGIPTCHVQHGIWGPLKYDGYYDVMAKDNKHIPAKVSSFRSLLKRQFEIIGEEYELVKRVFSHVKKALIKSGYSRSESERSKIYVPEELKPFEKQLVSQTEPYPIHADKMLVYGDYYKKQLRDRKPDVDEKRIDVVGYLRGDIFYKSPIDTKERVCERYGLYSDGPLALYFYSPFQEFPQKYRIEYHPNDALTDAINVLKTLEKNMNVLVLLHPNFRFEHYRREIVDLVRMRGFGRVTIDKAHDDHYSLFKHASIVIGVKSGALYEAMLANVPVVIQAYVLSKIHDPQHVEVGAVAGAFSPFHLSMQIERALTDKGFQERMFASQRMLCRDLLGSFDGKCGERAAAVLSELIRKAHGSQPDKDSGLPVR